MKSNESNRSVPLLLALWLVPTSACDSLAHRNTDSGFTLSPSAPPPAPAAPGLDASLNHPPCLGPGAREGCNGWDDDCDGEIDEDFDLDGDGFSTCATASAQPVDCDDTNPDIHPMQVDACDGLDSDCDDKWDEDEAASTPCPMTPLCSQGKACPGELVCVRPGEACVQPKGCANLTAVDTTCPAPANPFKSNACDPTQCGRWQDGTCWGTCECFSDGYYRYRVGCTE